MQKNDNYFTTCFSENHAKQLVNELMQKGYKSWYKQVFFVMPFNSVYYVYCQEL